MTSHPRAGAETHCSGGNLAAVDEGILVWELGRWYLPRDPFCGCWSQCLYCRPELCDEACAGGRTHADTQEVVLQ